VGSPKRQKQSSFTSLPHGLQDHENFIRLSLPAIKLLLNVARQYNGRNNGDLAATLNVMKKYGWNSNDTLSNASDCLLHYGMLSLTRQGNRNKCNLYALTWQKIHPHNGKLDVASTTQASGLWKEPREKWISKRSKKINFSTPRGGTPLHRLAV
jgi:hypothetical protein